MTIIKVVLCGPPHSGKSCLREGLKQAIRRIEGAPYPYVITACPDGKLPTPSRSTDYGVGFQ